MAVTKDFMEAVQSGKLLMVRIMLKDSLLIDPTGGQFDEMEQYAMNNMDGLYEEHDGEILNYNVSTWTEDYLNSQMVAVVNGFSKERVELLKSMVRFIYKEKVKKIHSERSESFTTHRVSQKDIGTGAAVAGVVLVAAGVLTAHTAITIGGVVVAATGVVLIASERGNN